MSASHWKKHGLSVEETEIDNEDEGNAIIFTFDNRHIEIVKYLVDVTAPKEFGTILRSGINALTSCFISNKFYDKFKPQTKIANINVNPIFRTKSNNFPRWINSDNVGRQEAFFPLYENSSDKIFQMIISGGYEKVDEAMSHLIRFLVLVYQQKCRGEPIYFYEQMTREEMISAKKLKDGKNYKYWMYNIFDKYKFPFKVLH